MGGGTSGHRGEPSQTALYFVPLPALSSLILVIRIGGCGGFLASVRDMGVTGQQQQARTVSAEDATRGGAGGFFISRGGATNPFSPVPSPESSVPVQRVAASAELMTFLAVEFFMVSGNEVWKVLPCDLAWLESPVLEFSPNALRSKHNSMRKSPLNCWSRLRDLATVAPVPWAGFSVLVLLLAVFLLSRADAQSGKDLYGADVYWNATPNDVNNLLKGMKSQTEANFQMDIRTLGQISEDPEKNPVLFRSGHHHFSYTPAERAKLRKYLLSGGMIIYNTGLGSKPFYDSVVEELKQTFPEQPLQKLTPDHPIFHSHYDVDRVDYTKAVGTSGYKGNEPWFDGVEVNCRVVALVSRWCMAVGWQGEVKDEWQAYKPDSAFKLGVNILSYASAMRAWAKNAAQAMSFVDKLQSYSDTVSVAQVVYNGIWKTRHAGLSVMLQTFNARTGIPVKFGLKELRLTDPAIFNAPVIYMTGHESFDLSAEEKAALKKYLENGGFLFAEACCGRKGFDMSFREMIRSVLPDKPLARIPVTASLFKEPNKITAVGVTPALMQESGQARTEPVLFGIQINGNYGVIYSPLGIAGGWEMSQSPYARGINDVGAIQIGQNVMMYSVTH